MIVGASAPAALTEEHRKGEEMLHYVELFVTVVIGGLIAHAIVKRIENGKE